VLIVSLTGYTAAKYREVIHSRRDSAVFFIDYHFVEVLSVFRKYFAEITV